MKASDSVLALLLFACLALGACSDAENTEGSGGGGNGGNADARDAWIGGDWTGHFQNKEADASSSLRETTAVAYFQTQGERNLAGNFRFEFPLLENVAVKGTFTDFAKRSLLLNIVESNFSSIGVAGSTTSMNYDLIGNSLEIYNDRVSIKLVREGGAGKGDGGEVEPSGKATTDHDLVGYWSCIDKAGRRWRLNIRSTAEFLADVFEEGHSSLTLDGRVTLQRASSGYDALLEVTSSKVARYVGSQLRLLMTSDMSLDLYLMDKNRPDDMTAPLDQFPCSKT